MAISLESLVRPESTALLLFELQRGVVGDLHVMPALDAATCAPTLLPGIARFADVAREAGVRVVHCIVEWRPDRRGMMITSPILAMMTKRSGHVLLGSPSAEIVPELAPQPSDLVSSRASGVTPFAGSTLDHMLRAEGVTTVVAVGAGLTLGLLGLAIEAIGLGYSVVLPTDGYIDVDPEFAATTVDRTLALLAKLSTMDDVSSAWLGSQPLASQPS